MSNLTTIFNNIAAAIQAKASTTEKLTPSEMPSAIMQIQSDGSDTDATFIPDDLPKDFRKTVNDNKGEFKYALGLLYRTSVCLGSTYTYLGKDIVTSDGQHFTGGTNRTPIDITLNQATDDGWWWIVIRDDERIVWNMSNNHGLKHFGLTWVYGTPGTQVHAYFNSPLVNAANGELSHLRIIDVDSYITYVGTFTHLKSPNETWIRAKCHGSSAAQLSSCMNSFCQGCSSLRYADITCEDPTVLKTFSQMFKDCYSLVEIKNFPELSGAINTSEMFAQCRSLRKIPNVINLGNSENTAKMFRECMSLEDFPETIDLSTSKDTSYMFENCYSLKYLPDSFNLSSSTNAKNMFSSCYHLRRFPTHLTCHTSISFGLATGKHEISPYFEKGSIATFDEDGIVNGGLVYNINTCLSSGQSIQFGTLHKDLFTSEQQLAIAQCLTDKNWTLAW